MKFRNMYAEYASEGGVDNVTAEDRGVLVSPNPVAAGEKFTVSSAKGITSVEVYDLSGRLVSKVAAESNVMTVEAPSQQGTYVVRAMTANTASSTLLIVR